ncbi:MAG: hypothetical protein IPL27_08195 [Lewinellaceae bacterium]|nr:hypothetical protein [Lewinellaceae bacterium]
MKPIRTILYLFAALFLFCSPLVAQNQVMITVHLSPPYSHRFADYNQYQVQLFLSLTNTTQQELQMKVIGEINGQGNGLFIKPARITFPTRSLPWRRVKPANSGATN